jgi:RNA polymerase sigma-70 factor (ECF subfamily)
MNLEPQWRETVDRALAGDRDAFEALIRKYARLVHTQAFMILGDHTDSEDVVQETFVKAYAFRVRLRDPAKFVPWLLSIARNLARDQMRRRHPTVSLSDSPEPEATTETRPEFEWQDDRDTQLQQVERELAALPSRYRDALALRYIDGLDYRAIERSLGITDGALRGILGRALAGIRRRLRRCEPGECPRPLAGSGHRGRQ